MNTRSQRIVGATHETPSRDKRARFPSSRYNGAMIRLVSCSLVLALSLTAAAAPTATLPKQGDVLPLAGAPEWPKLTWLYDAPSANDAAGKVIVHWFCATKVKACVDDLARIITLRDTGKVYIVAYINGGQSDAKKLDPIRESEGVGRGTVAYGPGVAKLVSQMGIKSGEAAFVVDLDGKVKALTSSGDINELDARDSLVTSLAGQIKEFTSSFDGPPTAKPGDKFALSIKIQLASWLAYSQKTPIEFTLTAPKDIKCDKATKIDAHTLTATATCSGPKGSYEAQGKIRFGYDAPGGGTGLGDDGTTYKFVIK